MPVRARQLSERLRLVRERLGKSQREFAADIDASFRAYQDYEAARILPGAKVLSKIATLGIDVNWLLRGSPIEAASAVVGIAHLDGRPDRPTAARIGFAPSLHSATLATIEIVGDSMAPELMPGDIAVFDTARRTVESGLFVLDMAGNLVPRRLQLLVDGAVEIQPGNAAYRPERLIAAAIAEIVVGRIVSVLKKV